MKDNCDPETGLCSPANLNDSMSSNSVLSKQEVIYVGDPMCSWCYGMAPELVKVKKYCDSTNIKFTIVLGGLRPGGGDSWTDDFKNMLKHHWKQVAERSGQSFSYELFDLEAFNYDTEPACRAVVALRRFKPILELELFEAVSQEFYMNSRDLSEPESYKGICSDYDVDYNLFVDLFQSDEIKKETYKEFTQNREWGVTGYPSLLLSNNGEIEFLSRGYTTYDDVRSRLIKLN